MGAEASSVLVEQVGHHDWFYSTSLSQSVLAFGISLIWSTVFGPYFNHCAKLALERTSYAYRTASMETSEDLKVPLEPSIPERLDLVETRLAKFLATKA